MTESLFAGGGYNTPPTNAPFLSVSPLELVSKNFQSGTVTFSQANSIFVQSQTDFLNGTSVATKKTETCFGRWEQGLEPLHIQVPPIPTIANVTIKSENISSGGSTRSRSDNISHFPNQITAHSTHDLSESVATAATQHHQQQQQHHHHHHPHHPHHHQQQQQHNHIRDDSLNSGCSRTIPISWTSGSTSSSTSSTNIIESRNLACPILQIKREPCQVSEISTSNNIGHTLATVVKIESQSPKQRQPMMDNIQNSAAAQSAGAIPVGIAVARQRLQEHVQHHQQQPKDLNRFGIGIATDLGGATSAFSQNMFFTGTNSTMIPFSSEAVTMGVQNVHNAVRTPPTLWQYPTPVPVESMLQMPPVGFHPSTGQLIFLPTAASIEPFQQAVVWPSYQQQTLQAPHLLMPSIAQQTLQPPPLTPLQLLGSDYLGGTTLHQHTQTHSTRLVALTGDAKRKQSVPNIPLPMQPTATLIKIEDCSSNEVSSINASAAVHQSSIYEPCKSTAIQTATITTAVQTSDLSPPDISHTHQLYYQSEGNLIQIAPHPSSSTEMMEHLMESQRPSMASHHIHSPHSMLTIPRNMTPPLAAIGGEMDHEHLDSTCMNGPEVQDANIQTDTPVMSDDDNTTGAEDCSFPSSGSVEINSMDESAITISSSTSYPDMCHNVTSISEIHSDTSYGGGPLDASLNTSTSNSSSSNNITGLNGTICSSRPDESGFESNTTVTSSSMIEELPPIAFHHHHSEPPPLVALSQQSTIPPLVPVSYTNHPIAAVPIVVSSAASTVQNSINIQYESIVNESNEPPDSYGNCSGTVGIPEVVTSAAAPPLSIPLPPQPSQSYSNPDISGLQLLSNSIEAFEKKASIKQEPIERCEMNYPTEITNDDLILQQQQQQQSSLTPQLSIEPVQEEPIDCSIQHSTPTKYPITDEMTTSTTTITTAATTTSADEPLGGLNLLCALAEQRFQEEVGHRNRKRSSSSEGSDTKRTKTKHHKEKHSTKKSSKKSKHNRDKRDRKKHTTSDEDESLINSNLKETFNRVKASYPPCSCQHTSTGKESCCRRDEYNWLTPEKMYSAMKSDMRYRLAQIAKQYEEQQRKLHEIKHINKSSNSDRELTPLSVHSSASATGGVYDEADAEKLESKSSEHSSPVPSESSQSDHLNQLDALSKSRSDDSYRFDDHDTNSSSASSTTASPFKRKPLAMGEDSLTDGAGGGGVGDGGAVDDANKLDPFNNKKAKSLVGYIFANKKRLNDIRNDNTSSSVTDETSMASDVSVPRMSGPAFKQEIMDEAELFGGSSSQEKLSPKHHHKTKHSSKHKKSKSKERKHRRRSSEAKERKRRIDASCLLTGELLDSLTSKTKPRVLTAMGGLFYAGCLSAIEPPDVYAVTLDGERGNRPHIMSREEILRDAILEVAPHSVDEIVPGTRLCAYWSQQYRCLYPGTAALPNAQDYEMNSKYLAVEFDDGDSGRIPHEDIRFLLSDYPIVEYDPNPLLSLGKRKQRTSQSTSDGCSLQDTANGGAETAATSLALAPAAATVTGQSIRNRDEERRASKERKRLKKLRKDKLKQDVDKKHKHKHKCSDEFCKHRKHKKRRKHKKYRHETESPESVRQDEEPAEQAVDAVAEDDSRSSAGDQTSETELVDKKSLAKQNTAEPFMANVKEETMTEEDASSQTESSGSCYRPNKKKDAKVVVATDNHSKIAAFLPARQLWAWSGKGIKRSGAKGRGKKQFFRTIQRGKETITIGDSAVFLSTGRPDRPYIGRIESLWETSSNNRVVRVKWYYHPEETIGCPKLVYPGALFQSPHADENDVQTISHKCKVLPFDLYTQKYGTDPNEYGSVYDNNDCFYLAGNYDPTAINLKFEPNIPRDDDNDDADGEDESVSSIDRGQQKTNSKSK